MVLYFVANKIYSLLEFYIIAQWQVFTYAIPLFSLLKVSMLEFPSEIIFCISRHFFFTCRYVICLSVLITFCCKWSFFALFCIFYSPQLLHSRKMGFHLSFLDPKGWLCHLSDVRPRALSSVSLLYDLYVWTIPFSILTMVGNILIRRLPCLYSFEETFAAEFDFKTFYCSSENLLSFF